MIPPRIVSGIGAVAAIAALSLPSVATAAKKPSAQGKKAAPQFYVSLGDSYASGYQPPAAGAAAGNTREGFVYQLPALAARRGWKLRVVNFACGGATTTSILEQKDCPPAALGPGAKGYGGKTQIQAAEAFLKKNRAKVGLVTVSIGGNDVTACVQQPDPVGCVALAQPKLVRNVTTLTRRLRKAAGPKVRIVGTTYPDVILGTWLLGTESGRRLREPVAVRLPAVDKPGAEGDLRGRRRQIRRRHGGHRRLHAARPDGRRARHRRRPGGGREGLRPDLVLRRAGHPREKVRLRDHR